MARTSLLVMVIQFAIAVAAPGQAASGPGFVANQLGPTVEDRLNQLHVPRTKDGLLAALRSENPEIRSLALTELVNEGVKGVIPEIAALMNAESEDPLRKASLAVDLARLGDERGVQTLLQYCSDTSVLMIVRLEMIDQLRQFVGHKSCPGLVIQGLQDPDDAVREEALALVPHFKELYPSQSPLVQAILLRSLFDSSSGVRSRAANTILVVGDVSAIPALEAAVNRETDSAFRAAMARTLKALKDKQQ
jgi:HEAT repeat protein